MKEDKADYSTLWARMALQLLEVSDEEGIWEVVRTIGNDVKAGFARLERYNVTSTPQEILDSFIDEELELVEDMVGIAFVAAQVLVTRVSERCVSIYAQLGIEEKSYELRRVKCVQVRGQSVVDLIHHIGNFYKHCDQWEKDRCGRWKATHSNCRTLSALRQLSADALYKSRPIEALCDALSFDLPEVGLRDMEKIVIAWKAAHIAAIKRELINPK